MLKFYPERCNRYQADLKLYDKAVREKLVSLYSDDEEQIYKEEADKLYNSGYYGEDNFEDGLYQAYENTNDRLLQQAEINGYVSLLAITGYNAIWEKQLLDMLKSDPQNSSKDLSNFAKIKDCYTEYGIDITKYSLYADIKELRLVTNVIKHGEGNSYNDLKSLNSPILSSNNSQYYTGLWSLSGGLLYPNITDIDRYAKAVIDFWEHSYWKNLGEIFDKINP